MKKFRKLQRISYGVLIGSFVVNMLINMFIEQASEVNLIEGLPVKVNAISIIATLAISFHFFVVHALVFIGDARKTDVMELIITGFPYLIFMHPFVISPVVWNVWGLFFATLTAELFFPDWPGRLLKVFQR